MADQQTPQQDQPDVDIKALRERADQAKVLEAQLAELRRDQAFRRAGIDPDDKRVSYFVKGYEGDLDVNAIRTEAQEAGFLAPPGPTSEQQQQLGEQERIQQVVERNQPVGGQDYEAQMQEAFAQGGDEGLMQYLTSVGVPISED